MKNTCFIKLCLCALACLLCVPAVYSQQTTPDTPILEGVSVDPKTGYITITWNVTTPPSSPISTDGFILYWRPAQANSTNYAFANIPNPATRSYTFNYDTLTVRTPQMPDPRKTTVPFTITAIHNAPYSVSTRSDPDNNLQVSNKYDSCRAEIRLNWYRYRGWTANSKPNKPLISYHVMRIPNGGGADEEIKVLSDSDTTYVVTRINENEQYTFYLKAERSDGVMATSFRTEKFTRMPAPPTFITAKGTQYNSSGLAEISFKIDPAAQTYSYEFLGSSKPDYSFVSLGTFNIHGDTVLTDLQTRGRTYYYKLEAWHVCKDKHTASSNMATALWLSLKQDDQTNTLQWDAYKNWGGAARYKVLRQVGSNPEEVLTTITDPASTKYVDDLSGVKVDGDVCYWVTALPVSTVTPGQHAVSNKICIKPESEIFIPQAFTPNGDGQNDEYKPFFSYPPQEFIFFAYDRTGAKVFQTEDFNVGWDGRLKNGKPANEGVYGYYLKFRTARGRVVEKQGTFTLVMP